MKSLFCYQYCFYGRNFYVYQDFAFCFSQIDTLTRFPCVIQNFEAHDYNSHGYIFQLKSCLKGAGKGPFQSTISPQNIVQNMNKMFNGFPCRLIKWQEYNISCLFHYLSISTIFPSKLFIEPRGDRNQLKPY
jgi:hypothetical protein